MTINTISVGKTPWIFHTVLALTLSSALPAGAATQEQADQLLADQQFSAATIAYRELIAANEEVAQNQFQLGQALMAQEQFETARAAYLAALAAGIQPEIRTRYHLARAEMHIGNPDAALEQLEALAALGGPPGGALQGTAEFADLKDKPRFLAVVTALTPCTTPEYRHFDFWLGNWDVTTSGATQATADNRISSVQGGCVVLEEYTNGAFTGMSLNFYDSVSERWHQTWMSNAGGSVYLEGGLNEAGEMIMTDRDLPISGITGTMNRVTWTPMAPGEVRQHWQNSSDGGVSWTTSFDGYYQRRD